MSAALLLYSSLKVDCCCFKVNFFFWAVESADAQFPPAMDVEATDSTGWLQIYIRTADTSCLLKCNAGSLMNEKPTFRSQVGYYSKCQASHMCVYVIIWYQLCSPMVTRSDILVVRLHNNQSVFDFFLKIFLTCHHFFVDLDLVERPINSKKPPSYFFWMNEWKKRRWHETFFSTVRSLST